MMSRQQNTSDSKAPTLRNWRHLGRGPAYCRLGRRIVYRQEDLDKFLEAGRIDPEARRGEAK